MRYVWMVMLIIYYIVWLISSIVDVVSAVKDAIDDLQCGICNSVSEFIDCMVYDLDESTIRFIALHLLALFFVSLSKWIMFKM